MLRTALTALAGLALIVAACGSPDSPDAGNPLDLGRDSEAGICHDNMMSLASAQSMYYGIYNCYATDLEPLYRLMGSDEICCPECSLEYILEGSEETYQITCPLPELPNHGYIADGIPCWPQEPTVDNCRSNMRGIAVAQSMYFGYYNTYAGDIGALREFYEGSIILLCPVCGETYELHGDSEHYSVVCPCVCEPPHGSVVDGITSW
jgi:hypothetical protein